MQASSSTPTFSSSQVWDRTGEQHTIDKTLFFFMITLWIMGGLTLSGLAAHLTVTSHPSFTWLSFISTFAAAVVGIMLAMRSKNPLLSLTGYAMVTIPFGILLGAFIDYFTQASLVKMLLVTGQAALVLGLIEILFPYHLHGWGRAILLTLTTLQFGDALPTIVQTVGIPVHGTLTTGDWVGTSIMSAYLFYDFDRAEHVERTHDNAIDIALATHLDFLYLPLRVLSYYRKRREH